MLNVGETKEGKAKVSGEVLKAKEEIAALKRLFTQIEDLDFETSDKYKFLTGDLS